MAKKTNRRETPEERLERWTRLYEVDDPAERIRSRYQISQEANALIRSGEASRDEVTAELRELVGHASDVGRLLDLAERVDRALITFASEEASRGQKGVSFSHLLAILEVSPASEQRALVERCIRDKISRHALKAIIREEYEIDGGREVIRLTQLARSLARALKTTNSAATQILANEPEAAARSVKPHHREKAIGQLDESIRLLRELMGERTNLAKWLERAEKQLNKASRHDQ